MEPAKISIQDASLRHLDRLYEIEQKCFKSEAFTKHQIAHLLAHPNSISLIAKDNRNIIGFIIGVIFHEREKLTGHILTIDVYPSHQRMGIGTMLLKQIEKIFTGKGVKTCYLEAREDNVAALNLYQKLGYRKVGNLKNYYRDAHGILFEKVLQE
ncbi:MAG: ribosomal protein S18-alanine N-acetyltransferase [Candidatus Bathyarchaeales archaeon]